MVGVGNLNKSPIIPSKNRQEIVENGQRNENLISPGFRSVAAMAGWDEEALLIASLIVEDTPDRNFKQKKRSVFNSLKTPPTNSRRKRRAQRRSPVSKIPVGVLDLDEDEPKSKLDNEKVCREEKTNVEVEKLRGDEEVNAKSSDASSSTSVIPCIDRLREELSCAICLEICYEPSTTACGHSFCKKCLRCAADRCGKKCPKCRQLISNGRYCTVNTVLWNTIQLLFPQEVEARKTAAAAEAASSASERRGAKSHNNTSMRSRTVEALNNSPEPNNGSGGGERRRNNNHLQWMRSRSSREGTRRELAAQDEDAALALRLQREEFMADESGRSRSSITTARANLRAMASRAMNIRIRGGGRRD